MTGESLQDSFFKKIYRKWPQPSWDLFEPESGAEELYKSAPTVQEAAEYIGQLDVSYGPELIWRAIHSIRTDPSQAILSLSTYMWLEYYSCRIALWRKSFLFAKDAGMIMCMLYRLGHDAEAKWLAKRIIAGGERYSWFMPEFTVGLLVTASLILGGDTFTQHRHRFPSLGIFESVLEAFESSDANWVTAADYLCGKHMDHVMERDCPFHHPFHILPVEVLALMRLRESATGRKVIIANPVVNMPFINLLEKADTAKPADKWLDLMLWMANKHFGDPDNHKWFDEQADAELKLTPGGTTENPNNGN